MSKQDDKFVEKGDFERTINKMNLLMAAVIIVLFIAFVSIIVDAWRFRASTYQELATQVSAQSVKVDLLYQQCTNYFHKH